VAFARFAVEGLQRECYKEATRDADAMRPKLFRDPVHDIIAFEQSDPVERVVFRLIQSRAFQRLRRIRQLGFANLVYHGAEHSRFAHSLGVLHVARRICETLELEPEDRLEVLCAAALHDVGHGPFSHAIESVTGVHHETYSQRLVADEEGELHGILADVDPDLPDSVARYFGPRHEVPRERRIFLDIVSSQLDADRLDYILRDGLATGVKIGVYDFERIQAMFQIYQGTTSDGEPSRRLAVGYRAREAVEGYLIARFHMFKQVYLHKTVRAAEKMLEAVLQRARQLLEDGYDFTPELDPLVARLLSGEQLTADEHIALDDTDIWVALKRWRGESDEILARLSAGLLDRRLYKTLQLDPTDPVSIARLIDRARDIARKEGFDPDYAVLVDRASDTPYSPYDPTAGSSGAHIPIIDRDGSVVPIEEVSDIVHLLGRDAYKIVRLCVRPEIRDELVRVAGVIG
jgi:HD superfamily phosphohydrolase